VTLNLKAIILFLLHIFGSRNSAVGVATGYGLDDRGVEFRFPVGSRIFFTSSRSPLDPTQSSSKMVPGDLSLGVKRQSREADHSSPTSAEIKKMWICTFTPPDAFFILPSLFLYIRVGYGTENFAGDHKFHECSSSFEQQWVWNGVHSAS
jgi:hypothetical protein